MPIRILVADDHPVLRSGLKLLLESKASMGGVRRGGNGRRSDPQSARMLPRCMILDLVMPVMNGYSAAIEIRRIAPSTKIVAYSVHQIPSTAKEVGADAFVSKSSDPEEIINTIERLTSERDPTRVRSARVGGFT